MLDTPTLFFELMIKHFALDNSIDFVSTLNNSIQSWLFYPPEFETSHWKYNNELLEEACREANRFNNRNVQYLERVIKMRKGVKRKPEAIGITARAHNPHLRGTNNIH